MGALLAAGCGGSGSSTGPFGTGLLHDRSSYYVALGDSLAQGVQPDQAGTSVDTSHGYPDQLYALLHRRDPDLRLVKLGCPGETTASMIGGRHCFYTAGSQLAAAAGFLRHHAGHISLITIDIGANDPNSCFTLPSATLSPPCARGPARATVANLARILASIRAAAGSRVPLIGMSYYDPELADWRYGPSGRELARRSEQPARAFDAALAPVYEAYGARVADVSGAFRSADFTGHLTLPGLGRLPRNVAAVCQWTWQCAPPPRGPNKHPNTAGYAVIARAFLSADHGTADTGTAG
jgi:lysophospholipase L1-like esterase